MPKIAIVGDVWNEADERARAPFSGNTGYILNSLLSDAGIHRADCFVTCAFNLRPPRSNDVINLCVSKKECGHSYPAIAQGKYVHSKYLPELTRLHKELAEAKPNVIIALGAAALWALTYQTGFASKRGTALFHNGMKILPTYHPISIVKDYSNRHTTVLDLMKAARESEYPDLRRPSRLIFTDPTLLEMESFYAAFLHNARHVAFDIETKASQITCIGFAPSIDRALVVPFWDDRRPGGNYWPDAISEKLAWQFVAKVLRTPARKVTQNGLYDVNFLWRAYGITVNNWSDDTMLMHHALHPEAKKGLGFLGSVYTNEASWKIMRNKTSKKEN